MIKKLNNKGFSLVELIIVVAIMAVLVGVLAPQFLRYVEKSRLQKDNSAIAEVGEAVKIACADEKINTYVGTGKTIALVKTGTKTFSASASDLLSNELSKSIGSISITSNTYKNATNAPSITVSISGGVVTVQGIGILETPDSTSATTLTF